MTRITRTRIAPIATLILSLLFLNACGGGGGGAGDEGDFSSAEEVLLPAEDDEVPAEVDVLQLEVEPVPTALDNFEFQFDQEFVDASDEETRDFINATIGASVTPFNSIDNVFLETTVPVTYATCGQANAFYIPSQRRIVICDELGDAAFGFFISVLDGTEEDIAQALEQANDASIFVLYHEMGHALDDIRELGVGGNFESVADAIGVVLSVQTGQAMAAINGGLFFLTSSGGSFADEHGAGEDRAGDVLCWVVGSGQVMEETFPGLAQTFINAGRDCVAEYANQRQFVEQLLPNLNDVPPVALTRGRSTEGALDRLAALDRLLTNRMTDIMSQ